MCQCGVSAAAVVRSALTPHVVLHGSITVTTIVRHEMIEKNETKGPCTIFIDSV